MHTVDHETPGPVSPLRRFRFMQSEDTALATLAAWTLGLGIFTLAGFYFGSIAGHDNHPVGPQKDLDPAQLGIDPFGFTGAVPYTVGGLAIGILFALFITFSYVPTKLRELELEQGSH